jgi:hypothetical protein
MPGHRLRSALGAALLWSALAPAAARAQFGDAGAEAGDRFGEVVARGDFDGDGYQDLAVGVPWEGLGGQAPYAGAVEVIYGAANGLDPANRQFWSQDSAAVEETAESIDFFGSALAAGDFNKDGFDDLAIGVPLEDVGGVMDAGAVNVLYGSVLGLSATSIADQLWHQDVAAVQDSAETGDEFGWSVGTGDFNGDGFADLAVGVVGESVGGVPVAGAVHAIYGSSAGLSATAVPDQFWHQNTSGVDDVAEADDLFGWSLATGDFNGDGRDDLPIGVGGEDVGSVVDVGAVNVIHGSPTGLNATAVPDQFWHQNAAGVEDVAEAGDAFGTLTAADFNGDGRDDLAIGARGENADAGVLHVIYGSATGLSATTIPDQLWHQDVTDVEDLAEALDRFGARSAAGDFNGDGFHDLAIAVRLEDVGAVVDAGAVNVLYGSSAGLGATAPIVDQFWHQDAAGVEDAVQPGDVFGWSLAAGDFNGDGADDLAVGTPGEDLGVVADAGAVNVIHGSTRGLDAQVVPDQLWHQVLIP